MDKETKTHYHNIKKTYIIKIEKDEHTLLKQTNTHY